MVVNHAKLNGQILVFISRLLYLSNLFIDVISLIVKSLLINEKTPTGRILRNHLSAMINFNFIRY